MRDVGCDGGSQHYSGAGVKVSEERDGLSSSLCFSLAWALSWTSKMQSTTLLTTIGSIYLKDSSKHHFTKSALKPIRPLVDLQQSPLNKIVSCVFFLIFQPVPQCYVTLVLKPRFQRKSNRTLSVSRWPLHFQGHQITAVSKKQKKKMTENADWSQRDSWTSKRVR